MNKKDLKDLESENDWKTAKILQLQRRPSVLKFNRIILFDIKMINQATNEVEVWKKSQSLRTFVSTQLEEIHLFQFKL